MKNIEQENNLGNDRGRDSVAPRLFFLFFHSSLNSLHFWPFEPFKTPLGRLFIGKGSLWGSYSSPRWAET